MGELLVDFVQLDEEDELGESIELGELDELSELVS